MQVGSKQLASRDEKPSKRKQTPSVTLAYQVAELASTVHDIQVLLSMPPTHWNLSERTRACVSASPLPRCELASSFSRYEPDTLSLAASDSLDKDEQDYYTHLDEASSHCQSQCSHSDNGSSLKGTAASVVFSLQDTLTMVFAKLNLDPPPPVLGHSNLLHRQVSQQKDLLMPSCPDFTKVVFYAFWSALIQTGSCGLAMAEVTCPW